MKTVNKLVLVLVSVLLAMPAFCATTKADPKAEQRKLEERVSMEEEAFEASLPMDKRPNGVFAGALALYEAPAGEVLGSFATQAGQQFLIKATRPEVIADLKKFNMKMITLVGKVRVKGKYLLVEAVNIPQPGPTRGNRNKRGGG